MLLRIFIIIFSLFIEYTLSYPEKLNLDALNNYSEFLNLGEKKLHKIHDKKLENSIFKSKLDVLGEIFKKNIQIFKLTDKLDIVFLVDASSSVGDHNFKSELKFIKKLLSDITVDYNHTRVSVVTFSSPSNTIKNIDDISDPSVEHNKCLLLNERLMNIEYLGGETYTFGAFEKAKEIFESSKRNDSRKVIFLITDGYSNGEDPVPLSNQLKSEQISIFTIGIRNGNYKELYELSSSPAEFHSYLLDSFQEFESLARRALHVDLPGGDYLPLGIQTPCDKLCDSGNCCDTKAFCSCGTITGHYSCTCQPGYYGSGLENDCQPCTAGTYSDGPNLCLPCPDVQHTTILPAFGIESCVCKRGFQSNGLGGCQILKCPKIKPPQFGYIVKKKECSNVLNSACGIRCEVGYTLVGSSIRLCQQNASWTGSDPTCEVKICNKLLTPKFGSIQCEQPDLNVTYGKSEKNFPVDTECNFKCMDGTILIGSRQRTCLPIAQWDGLRTICKPIKCNKLPHIKYGKVQPTSCTIGKQEFGKTCRIICNKGFEPSGSIIKTCSNHGVWNNKHEPPTTCQDVTPPELECPKNITSSTIPGTLYGQVFWTDPEVNDNSDLNVSIWISPGITDIGNYKFTIGLTPVTYFAQDAFNNAVTCKFFVEILDKELPTIEGCINPTPFLVAPNSNETIIWDEPNFFDNSQNVSVAKSHTFGFFPIGTTVVTYSATDPSGNINVCKINITLEESQCPDFAGPQNGQTKCQDQSSGVQCVITCSEGYGIPFHISAFSNSKENSTSFLCNHAEAIWHNQEGVLYPECSITEIPTEVKEGTVRLSLADTDDCGDSKLAENIENDLKSSISNTICNGTCEIDIKAECELEKSEESTNELLTRRKRIIGNLPLNNNNNNNRDKKHRKKKKLQIKYNIKGKYLHDGEIKVPKLNSTISMMGPSSISCPTGYIIRKHRCVQCPRGTFHNILLNLCQSCDFGFYNDQVGQIACRKCPSNYSTRKMHVKNFKECREMCPPGTMARKKSIKVSKHGNLTIERATLSPYCKSCPIGTYQSQYGQIACKECPSGFTTLSVHSTTIKNCISTSKEICKSSFTTSVCNNNGKCKIINEYEYSCECYPGFVGTFCETRRNLCESQPCYNLATCIPVASVDEFKCVCSEGFSGKYCEEIIEKTCNISCQNNGICIDDGATNGWICLCPMGFSGNQCETKTIITAKTTICTEELCENNGTCIEQGYSYECKCSKGFLGRRCNVVACDYKPCPEASICINLDIENATKSDFRCICPEGRTGSKCMDKIDYCFTNPCQHNANCSNEETNYTCKCSKLFYGPNCEFKRETNYLLNFLRYDTSDFVQLRGFDKNLSEITACLSMQTTDNFNYGTLLSYATKFKDNAFTLTDYTGLVFYINNEYIVTDLLLNDGFWHHICVSWQSFQGIYKIYIDGKLATNGENLGTSTELEANGIFVIGQDQDVLGGRFSKSESFVGKMSYVDIWSKILTPEEILEHQNDCSEKMLGDIYAWPEMYEHINGNVQVLLSTFCQECEDPEILYNGHINVIEHRAYYSCYEGFQISSQQFTEGRKCTKTSKWEGFYDPECKKVTCGYPGVVKNALSEGNRYFYNDTVIFKCYEGFKMIGNSSISCTKNGLWYPKKPKCIGKQCKLPKIIYGNIQIVSDLADYEEDNNNQQNVDLDTQIKVACTNNTILVGESILTCLENGSWDNFAECRPKKPKKSILECPLNLIPVAPLNGYITDESLNFATNGIINFVEYKCNAGYKIIGINTATCIVDGYWSDHKMICKAEL